MGLLESEICGLMKYVKLDNRSDMSLVMMGKQDVHCTGSYFLTMAKNFNWNCDKEGMTNISSHNEIDSYDMFRTLGFSSVDAIDYSDYEGANIVCDLNNPISHELHEKYDWVINGGTLEHVFNIAVAMQNMTNLVKVGGYICHIAPSDGWVDHGFYSISPTFFRDYYEANGFDIECLELEIVCDEKKDGVQSYFCGDMRLLGSSSRMNRFIKRRLSDGEKALIFCIARKNECVMNARMPIQGMWKKLYEVEI